MDSSDLKRRLIASIDQRYRSHAAKDLADYIFSNHLFHTPTPALVDFTFTYRQDIIEYLSVEHQVEELVGYCVRATRQYTYQRNQFINLSEVEDQLLYAEYHDFIGQISAALSEAGSASAMATAYAAILKRHHERLRLLLSTYCLSNHQLGLRENPLLRTVPCEEYSVPFQLELLKIDLARLAEPILDIGCGTSATLVNFLRNRGLMAFGLDRLAPAGSYFFQQDWLNFDYARQPWGTIIAHQSFSTHFIYNHLHNPARAEQYARLFMRILAGLKPGGVFYYAPGLPFFEEHLGVMKEYTLAGCRKSNI